MMLNWEAIGFEPIPDGEPVVASFYSIHIYEVQGFLVPDEPPVFTHKGEVSGAQYSIALGSSVNTLARAISFDDFVDDEQAWATERRCTPPYVMIHFGPSQQYSCTNGYMKDEAGILTTGDCFQEARAEIRALESKVLPSLTAALTCGFSWTDHPVRFKPVHKLFIGQTTDNRTLQDVRYEVKAHLYSSKRLDNEEAQSKLESAAAYADKINPKVSRFLHLALEEDDLLKQFLYYFLSIEIETHSVFGSIDHSKHLTGMVNSPERLRKTTSQFFQAQREKWTSLKDRFVWCALCVWTHLTDTDIDSFTRLKKIRDDIAHGSIAVPPSGAVVAAANLAKSLHRSHSQLLGA